MEDLIRRAKSLLGFGLSEAEAHDILRGDASLTEEDIFLAVRAAGILVRA